MITVSEVRDALGEAYETYPSDAIIQGFIDRRSEELRELTGLSDLAQASYQSLLKKWLLNKVCIDVLRYELLGKDATQALDYSIGDLKASKSKNIDLKLKWIETMEEAAERALDEYFAKTISFEAVSP